MSGPEKATKSGWRDSIPELEQTSWKLAVGRANLMVHAGVGDVYKILDKYGLHV